MWSHREHLLRVARRRSMSMEDAEDAVHEAMVRAAERPHVDGDRLGAWLTTVTVRLCVDRFRQLAREGEVHARSVLAAPGQVTVEEAVCDRAEARWLADRRGDLPARQAEALGLRAQGLDLPQIAERMGLSYRAVQSLLARARKALHATLAGTLGIAVWLWRGRPRAIWGAQTVTLVSAAVTLAIAGLNLPALSGTRQAPATRLDPYEAPFPTMSDRLSKRPAVAYEPAASSTAAESGAGGLALSAEQYASGQPSGAGPELADPGSGGPSGLPEASLPSVPALPDISLPGLPAPPDVLAPALPTPSGDVPTLVEPVELDGAPADMLSTLPPPDAPPLQH
ncbi:sigma-70 family RNA polymerase sigma factor [Streptomyces sp. NPDC005407]|uniref:RNA polymerase sigma factor n=1 Tax=Streptomyces sp. NPDC005407 TaxID=3155340 RepID=UPI0033AF6136